MKISREVKERPEPEESDPPAKITRLAIGVEGGFQDRTQFQYEVIRYFGDTTMILVLIITLKTSRDWE